MSRRVAIVTCRGDDVDPDSPILLEALRRAGVARDLVVWDDPAVDWSAYDLVVLRSTWDYAPRRDEFLAWAKGVAHLVNPYPVVAYSSDKHYLADLARRGHAVVDSLFCDVGTAPVFPAGNFVVKPAVGAGSIEADRYGAPDHERARAHVARLHALGRDVVIQPYVDAVDTMGERALIYIDGRFSHAMTKGAMLNVTQLDRHALFRREQMSRAEAEPDALALADEVLAEPDFADLLYARVDMVRTAAGWAVMELELIEPSLFLAFDERAADRLAAAIRARLP